MQQQNQRGPRRSAGRPLRLALGGIAHETNTFAPRPTALDDFGCRAYLIGDNLRLLAVKSSVHFRAAFAAVAGAVIEVETPGLSSSNLAAFPYQRVRRPIAPLDGEVGWHG